MNLSSIPGTPRQMLASSLAGGMRNAKQADRMQSDQALQKQRADQVVLSTAPLGEVSEEDLGRDSIADRDGDGRLPWQAHQRREGDSEDSSESETPSRPDTDNTRPHLDLLA